MTTTSRMITAQLQGLEKLERDVESSSALFQLLATSVCEASVWNTKAFSGAFISELI